MKFLTLLCLVAFAYTQNGYNISYIGDRGINDSKGEKYFEQKVAFSGYYDAFQVGVTYSAFNPPRSYSFINKGKGVFHRYVEYQKNEVTARVGTFYSIFGRGLTLNAYSKADLGYDTKIDGLQFKYTSDLVSIHALAGDVIGSNRELHQKVKGAELRFTPLSQLELGGSFVNTDMKSLKSDMWTSIFSQYESDYVTIYSEYAQSNKQSEESAFYGSLSAFYENTTLLFEYKNYDQFKKSTYGGRPLALNDAPTLVQEDKFALWGRHAYYLNMYDEVGFATKLDQWLSDAFLITAVYSESKTHEKRLTYRETSLQLEWTLFDDYEWIVKAGNQEDLTKRYKNLSTQFSVPTSLLNYSLTYEIQRAVPSYTKKEHFNNSVIAEVTMPSTFSIALFVETTNEKASEPKKWIGVKTMAYLTDVSTAYVFYGKRKKGKVCSGGVCIFSPEFDGIEFGINLALSGSF